MPYDQGYGGGMSPQQMIQFGLGMTQPRQPNMQPIPYYGGGGSMQAMPYQGGGTGGMQKIPFNSNEVPDPLDAYSDDDIAKAYAKRQSRARIGGKVY